MMFSSNILMVDANDLEADLVIALQTLDTVSFRKVLEKSDWHLLSLQDQNRTNIFHEFAKSIIKESLLVEFLEIITSFLYRRYSEKAPENLKIMMNSQTLDEGLTPLHIAIETGKIVIFIKKLVKEYIRMGSSIETKTKKDQSIVHLACLQGGMPILAYLKYEIGVDFSQQDQSLMMPLHVACKSGNIYVVQALLAWGSEVNPVDSIKNTPLHYAALNGNYRISRALIISGADRLFKNSDREIPFDTAKKAGNIEVLKILVIFN